MTVHLRTEIDNLKKNLLGLSAIVEDNVRNAVEAVDRRDSALAEKVIENDKNIDQKEVELEEECLKILALHQPVAIDLRLIIAALKLNNDLERISDLASKIAKRALFLNNRPELSPSFEFRTIAEKAQAMLAKSLDSLVNLNPDLAYEVCAEDDEVDALQSKLFTTIDDRIEKHAADLEALLCVRAIFGNLERIADHATNIAEDVIYMIEGDIVRHQLEDGNERMA